VNQVNESAAVKQYREIFYRHYKSDMNDRKMTLEEKFRAGKPFLMRIIQRYFPSYKDAKIIDFGCGNGGLIFFAKECGYKNTVGYDISENQVKFSNAAGFENIYHEEVIAAAKSIETSSVDLVVSFDVLEHMTKDEALLFLLEVFRILKDSGKWIIHTVNAESPFFGRIRYGDFTHECAFTKTSIKQFLSIANFRKIQCVEDNPIVHSISSMARYMLWKLIRSFYRLCLAIETGERNAIFSQNFLVVAEKHE